MLINLSNHPSANWSEAQMAAVRQLYGSVVDLPFPNIDPSETVENILKMTDLYRSRCIELFTSNGHDPKADTSAVHVMGEMTFTYNMVRYLRHRDICTVASTTERVVNEDANGVKTSVFRFVQFRPYHWPDEIFI